MTPPPPHFPAETSMVIILYWVFNKKNLQHLRKEFQKFSYVQTCLHILKFYSFAIKPFNIQLIDPSMWNTIQNSIIQLRIANFSLDLTTEKTDSYSLISTIWAPYTLNFNLFGLLIPRHIECFFGQNIDRKKYVLRPKIIWFRCTIVVFPTSTHRFSKLRITFTHNGVRKHWSFEFSASIPDDSIIILQFTTDKSNSSRFPLCNKAILDSYLSEFSDVGF